MLYTASYILNNTSQPEGYPIHPFCHSLGNIETPEGAIREIRVPDVLPSAHTGMDLSMAAGDFLEIYNDDSGESLLSSRDNIYENSELLSKCMD